MINSGDPETIASISVLKRLVRQNQRPVVLWIGAGASLWAGLPSWKELARGARWIFQREVVGFDDKAAGEALSLGDFPAVFELCKIADERKYHALLLQKLSGADTEAPLYKRLIEKLKAVSPKLIVTTNPDLLVEQSFPGIDVIERSDLERLNESIVASKDFVGKLHGSISSISSTIFASSEYSALISDATFIESLKHLFATASVVFLGYGVRDQYVLDLIREEHDLKKIFGAGPHFIVTSSLDARSDSLRRIVYRSTHESDHRAALYVLDFIKQSETVEFSATEESKAEDRPESAIYISQFLPPGTYQMSQTATFGTPDNPNTGELSIGVGFAPGETSFVSRAFHDLLVGLICFDKVYLPLEAVPRLNSSANPIFDALIDDGSIRFVHLTREIAIINRPGSLLGNVASLRIQDAGHDESKDLDVLLRKFLAPAPGMETVFESRLVQIKSLVNSIGAETLDSIPQRTGDALIMPRVAELIGLSDAVVPSAIPQWLRFPTLRLSHLIVTSRICSTIGAQSVRVPFGGTALINATFGLQGTNETADTPASYIVTGRFGSNLSGVVETDLSILLRVLKFRYTSEAISLRSEIRDSLKFEIGAEFEGAVNAGLSRTISASILDASRDRLNQLAGADGRRIATPAVWTDPHATDAAMVLWKTRSRENLKEIMRQAGLTKDSECVCGSGESIKNCCLRALRLS